jgi:DHA2 family multidrug resistance protein
MELSALIDPYFVRSPKYGEKLKSNQVDWIGIILLASFIGSLQFVLEHGQDDWFNNPLRL